MKPVSLNKKIILGGIHFLQSLLLVGVGILQHFTRYRPMLMRHLYTRNIQYTEAYFSNGLLLFQTLFLSLLFIGSLWLLQRTWKINGRFVRWERFGFTIAVLFPLLFIHLEYFKALTTYPYWVFAGYFILVLQGSVQLILKHRVL